MECSASYALVTCGVRRLASDQRQRVDDSEVASDCRPHHRNTPPSLCDPYASPMPDLPTVADVCFGLHLPSICDPYGECSAR